jgi:hypothetical protein
MTHPTLEVQVAKLAQLLLAHQLMICTAESCTGGMVAAALGLDAEGRDADLARAMEADAGSAPCPDAGSPPWPDALENTRCMTYIAATPVITTTARSQSGADMWKNHAHSMASLDTAATVPPQTQGSWEEERVDPGSAACPQAQVYGTLPTVIFFLTIVLNKISRPSR